MVQSMEAPLSMQQLAAAVHKYMPQLRIILIAVHEYTAADSSCSQQHQNYRYKQYMYNI